MLALFATLVILHFWALGRTDSFSLHRLGPALPALPTKAETVINTSRMLLYRLLWGALLGCVFRGFGVLPWRLISGSRVFRLIIVQKISTQVDRD